MDRVWRLATSTPTGYVISISAIWRGPTASFATSVACGSKTSPLWLASDVPDKHRQVRPSRTSMAMGIWTSWSTVSVPGHDYSSTMAAADSWRRWTQDWCEILAHGRSHWRTSTAMGTLTFT